MMRPVLVCAIALPLALTGCGELDDGGPASCERLVQGYAQLASQCASAGGRPVSYDQAEAEARLHYKCSDAVQLLDEAIFEADCLAPLIQQPCSSYVVGLPPRCLLALWWP